MVKLYGPKFSVIKSVDEDHYGGILHRRSQVDLKDKCRNITYQHLKAKVVPPEGLEDYPIGAKLERNLLEMGIPPRPYN